ncbi:unnamed protein product [Cylicocyclus nassatus]|uniref:Uncharacterized protein n=1 Tax=Cylicocyclus nassatus TaxID=53992 RepID=A0AA36GPR4_CYLNA|nr:unnamed protein product [Cylicocyclus nassatus]
MSRKYMQEKGRRGLERPLEDRCHSLKGNAKSEMLFFSDIKTARDYRINNVLLKKRMLEAFCALRHGSTVFKQTLRQKSYRRMLGCPMYHTVRAGLHF